MEKLIFMASKDGRFQLDIGGQQIIDALIEGGPRLRELRRLVQHLAKYRENQVGRFYSDEKPTTSS